MRYIRKVLPFVLTGVLLVIVLLALSNLVTPKNNAQDAGHDAWAAYGFEAEPEDTIDVFIIGDSESRTSISPMKMFHDVGITSYCCGVNACNLSDEKQMLKRILKTQSPKLVILEANVIFTELDWEYILFSDLSYLFPVLTWHDRWKHLTVDDFTKVPESTQIEARKGYYHAKVYNEAPTYLKDRYMREDDTIDPIPPANMHVFRQIAALCRKNGIDLLVLSAPSIRNWDMAKSNAVRQLVADEEEAAAKAGTTVKYVDMNLMTDEIPIDWDKDTRDEGDHLNNSGMEKVCNWLGPWLKENYGLKDHREDPACRKTWTDLYDDYIKWIS